MNPAPTKPPLVLAHNPSPSATVGGTQEDGDTYVPVPKKLTIWNKIGGGALAFAVIFHVILLIIGAIWIFQIIREPEKKVDFLPGNGDSGGSERSAQHKMQQKKQAQITPTSQVKRVFAEGALSNYAIPENGDNFGTMSPLSSLGGGGASGGLGGSGGGKGFGIGAGSGLGTKGLGMKMFGLQLEGTAKIAVVMDVSRSMTKYLPLVAREMDKLPSSAPLVLYFGCGLAVRPKGIKHDDKIRLSNGPQFDRFWQLSQGAVPLPKLLKGYESLKYDSKAKMPLPALYKEMSYRHDTYFLDFNGIFYSQEALICNEIKDADTIYWFSDFQDKVDDGEIKDILRKLKSRRQKLIMHAPVKGKNFEKLEHELAKPSGGQAIFKELKAGS